MDIGVIANIGVACGTIVLAIATFAIVRQGKLQLQEMKKQIQISLLEQEPKLKWSNLEFIQDKPRFRITNIGKGRAIHIGVSTGFNILKNNFPQIDAGLKLEDHDALPGECVSFPTNNGEMILDPKESAIFESEILFWVPYKKQIHPITHSGRAFNFQDLKIFLEKHNIHTITVDIGVIGKNLTEVPISPVKLAEFSIDFTKHNTLKEAYEEFIKTDSRLPYVPPTPVNEIPWLPYKAYCGLRSNTINF